MIKDSVTKVAPANTIFDPGFGKDALRSTASLEKVPNDLLGLGDDIRKISEKVYGQWVAINWHGSIPRGDFVAGESDADFTIITKEALPEGHQELRKSLLDDLATKWAERGVAKLDVIAVPLEELHEPFRRNVLFFCYSDGVNIEGSDNLDLSFVLPETSQELTQLLNKKFELWIETAKEDGGEDVRYVEQLRKRTIRAIYACAMLQGAPYLRGWRTYGPNIDIYASKYSQLYSNLINNSVPFKDLVQSSEFVRDELVQSGVKFDKEW